MEAPVDVLTLVERLVAARPFNLRKVETLTGVRLREDRGNSNPYIALHVSEEAHPPLTRVELRLPLAGATRRDGLLILDLDPAAVQVRQAQIQERFGSKFTLVFPTAGERPDGPLYHTYSYPWGDLRFGLGRSSGLLEAVVIDAER